MERLINLSLSVLGEWNDPNNNSHIGIQGEDGATIIKIEIPSSIYGATHRLEFIKPSGATGTSAPLSETIETVEDVAKHYISFEVGEPIINEIGRYQMQYVGLKGNASPIVIKSKLKALDVIRSVSAGLLVKSSNADFFVWVTNAISELYDVKEATINGYDLVSGLILGPEDISYQNENLPDVTNVQEALDTLAATIEHEGLFIKDCHDVAVRNPLNLGQLASGIHIINCDDGAKAQLLVAAEFILLNNEDYGLLFIAASDSIPEDILDYDEVTAYLIGTYFENKTNFQTLSPYWIGSLNASAVILTINLNDILANNDLYFTKESGTGSSSSPYVIRPRIYADHRFNHYVLNVNTEPSRDVYIDVKPAGSQKVLLTINRGSTVFNSLHIYCRIYNANDVLRKRVTLNNTIIDTYLSTSATNWTITLDINSPELYHSSSL